MDVIITSTSTVFSNNTDSSTSNDNTSSNSGDSTSTILRILEVGAMGFKHVKIITINGRPLYY